MPKPDWMSGVSGGIGGAGTGFAIGGPPGAAVGGGLGFLSGLFGSNFAPKDRIKQASNLSPDQQALMGLLKQGLESGEGAFGELFGNFNPQQFNEGVRDPALKDFQENILPMLREKYIANNQAGGSSQQAGLMKAGTDLQAKLAQLMYQARQEQLKNKLSGIQTALGIRPFENYYKQGEEGFGTGLVRGAAPQFGNVLGNILAAKYGRPTQNPANPPNLVPPDNQPPTQVG